MTELELDALLDRAAKLGRNYATRTEGAYHYAPLSGEWADQWTPLVLAGELGLSVADPFPSDYLGYICDAFEESYRETADEMAEYAEEHDDTPSLGTPWWEYR